MESEPTATPAPRRDPASARLFVALWPDAAVRARLAALRDAWRWPPGTRTVAEAHLHATLHYIGSFERACIAALGERLAAVATPSITVRVEGTAVWRGGVAVLTLQRDTALAALHDDVGAALREFGIALDPRPFAPHVTLARKAVHAEPPSALPELGWHANGFALVESLPGPPARYEPLAMWGSRGAQDRSGGPPPAR